MKVGIQKVFLLASAALLVLPLLAGTARADSFVDFSCGGTPCSGTVINSSGTYSTTGIGGLQQSENGGPDYMTGSFNLVFNTSTDTISLTGNSAAGGDTLSGKITNLSTMTSGSQSFLAITANWTTLPSDFSTYLNAGSGSSVGSVIYLSTSGAATSVDFTISPTATPEPASFLLLGMGLLGLGAAVRFKGIQAV